MATTEDDCLGTDVCNVSEFVSVRGVRWEEERIECGLSAAEASLGTLMLSGGAGFGLTCRTGCATLSRGFNMKSHATRKEAGERLEI